MRHKSGNLIHALVSAQIVEISQEKYLLGQIVDITERKRAEQDLRESEARFRSVLDNSADLIYRVNGETNQYEYVSPSAERVMGYTAAEIMAIGPAGRWPTIHPDDRALVQSAVEHLHRTGSVTFEYRQRHRNGDYRWVANSLKIVEDGSGRPLYRDGILRDITAHKQAQAALVESNAKLERLFEVLPVGISVLDRSGQVVKENPMLEAILGLSKEGLARGDYRQRQYIQPDGTPMLAQEFPSARVLRGEASVHDVDIGVVKENGEAVWTRVSAAAVPFSDWNVVIATHDITERKRAEEALRASEEKYAAIFQKSAVPMALSKMPEGVFADVNDAFQTAFGYTRQEVIGKTSLDLGMADARQRGQTYADLEQFGIVLASEKHFRTKSGEIRTFLVNIANAVFAGQNYVITTIHDITERRRAEEALLASERKFRTIAETAGEGVAIAEPTGAYTFVNQRLANMLGYAMEDILGKSSIDFTFADWRPQVAQARAALDKQQTIQGEFQFRRQDGSVLWTFYHATAMYNEQGEHIANFAMHTDITERKRMQSELEQAHAQLQTISRQLLDVQENERRAVARELHDEIGQALTAIKMNLQAAQLTPDAGVQAQRLTESARIVDRTLRQTRDLALNLRPSLLDDFGLVTALEWYLTRETERAGLPIELVAAPEELRLPPRLETTCFRVVQSAITNVVRHAQARRVRVEVRQTSPAQVTILIEDDGVGFDVPARLAQARRGASVGLLALQERVQLANGVLDITSAPGQGTRVQATLPIEE